MARLNEALGAGAGGTVATSTNVSASAGIGFPGVESLEALKRRFMRQNRELAKSNSELKIKVAMLEADRAQLLSENITLRDRNNHLQQDIVKSQYSRKAVKNVGLVREKLMVKVSELNALMAELDIVPPKPAVKGQRDNTARRKSFKRSPTQVRNWKNSLFGPDFTGLEAIVEGKQFPRRTLDADETQQILPELPIVPDSPCGQPPSTEQGVVNEQIAESNPKITIVERQEETREEQNEEPLSLHAHDSETRRKRRTSALMKLRAEESKGEIEGLSQQTKAQVVEPSLKIGAKRKFDLREENDGTRSGPADHTSFHFSRKSGSKHDPTTTNRQMIPLPERNVSKVAERARNIVGEVKARKALGEKAVNTDPVVSPVKSRNITEKADRPELLEKVKERQKHRQTNKEENTTEKRIPKSIEIPPATPAQVDIDLFSPTESISSAQPNRDTPPPSELTSKSAENTRPSRRQRAQVSYAEPSLRDKMRRPGKELADAVITGKVTKEGIQSADPQEAISIPNWGSLPVDTQKEISEPTSPLQSKSLFVEYSVPSTVATDRRRKSSIRPDSVIEIMSKEESSKQTMALTTSQRRLSRIEEPQVTVENSSSEILDTSSPESIAIKSSHPPKQSRRHSSISDLKPKKDTTSVSQKYLARSEIEDSGASRAERIASRRRSMQL